ncbi:type VI secretion system baseplate subunit TssG [Desulfococcaceae bacterium HSG7]|nr:type VI secretion system baseplate subunit TssG [Desulfococcaceae bacterium HSG7]
MATQDRQNTSALKKSLLSRSGRFSFFQAGRLLRFFLEREYADAERGNKEDTLTGERPARLPQSVRNRAIRIRPQLSLAFPPTDIVSIKAEKADDGFVNTRYLVTAAILGLYGESSPLPTFYTEELFQEARDGRTITRDFFDIINTPLYQMFFQAQSKYRLGIKVVEEEDSSILERLFCLTGFGGHAFRNNENKNEKTSSFSEKKRKRQFASGATQAESSAHPNMDFHKLIRYSGLFNLMPRSALGLETLLADALKEPGLQIISCVARLAKIPEDQRFSLGVSGTSAGKNCFLGHAIPDRMGKFRVRLGPMDWDSFQAWLPHTDKYRQLKSFIEIYVDQLLEWDLEVILGVGEARSACLQADGDSRLGWTGWLLSQETCEYETPARFEQQ